MNQSSSEGTWVDMWTFVSELKLDYKRAIDDEESVLEALAHKYSEYDFGRSEKGICGVRIYDMPKGAERFREGVDESIVMVKQKVLQSSEAARDEFEQFVGKQARKRLSSKTHEEGDEPQFRTPPKGVLKS